MSQHELTRKEMKEPDKFQAAAGEAAGWMSTHRKGVLGVLGVLGAAVVIAIAVSAWQAHRAEQAGAALAAVATAMQGEVSTVPLPGVPGPFFPSEEARQRAVLEAAEKVRGEFGGTAAAHTATLAAGDAHYRLGEWDQAIAAYQAYAAEAKPGDSLLFGALEGIGLAEEAKGNLDGAAQAFERMGREVPAQSARADLERARVLAQAGRTADARALLQTFPEQHKDSPLVGEAADRLAKLGTP
jgi:tetratricopeptide (TPR) repeat protein